MADLPHEDVNFHARKRSMGITVEWDIFNFKLLFDQKKTCEYKTGLIFDVENEDEFVIAKSPTFEMRGTKYWLKMMKWKINGTSALFTSLNHSHKTEDCSIICQLTLQINDIETYGSRIIDEDWHEKGYCRSTFVNSDHLLANMSSDNIKVLCCIFPDDDTPPHPFKYNEGIVILSSNVKDLFEKGENSDFAIKVKEKTFQVHKAILSARSPVLAAMLKNDMAENRSGTTNIDDCEPNAFERFLLYLYSGEVEDLSWENVVDLYKLADKYDLPHLRRECLKFMEGNLSIDAFCDAISLAVKHNESTLVSCCEEFFVANVNSILVAVKWQLLLKENPMVCNELFIKHAEHSSKKQLN